MRPPALLSAVLPSAAQTLVSGVTPRLTDCVVSGVYSEWIENTVDMLVAQILCKFQKTTATARSTTGLLQRANSQRSDGVTLCVHLCCTQESSRAPIPLSAARQARRSPTRPACPLGALSLHCTCLVGFADATSTSRGWSTMLALHPCRDCRQGTASGLKSQFRTSQTESSLKTSVITKVRAACAVSACEVHHRQLSNALSSRISSYTWRCAEIRMQTAAAGHGASAAASAAADAAVCRG